MVGSSNLKPVNKKLCFVEKEKKGFLGGGLFSEFSPLLCIYLQNKAFKDDGHLRGVTAVKRLEGVNHQNFFF